jgi:hypothetical protein
MNRCDWIDIAKSGDEIITMQNLPLDSALDNAAKYAFTHAQPPESPDTGSKDSTILSPPRFICSP